MKKSTNIDIAAIWVTRENPGLGLTVERLKGLFSWMESRGFCVFKNRAIVSKEIKKGYSIDDIKVLFSEGAI